MPSNDQKISNLDEYLRKGKQLLVQVQNISKTTCPPRRYKGGELAKVLGVSPQAVYGAEREGRLPAPDLDPANGRRLGATQEQMLMMQRLFDTRPEGAGSGEAITISFSNFKGGCWKTTSAWYAGTYYAQLGYKVLFIDVDPQASLTQNCGIMPDSETSYENTLGPYLSEDGEIDPVTNEPFSIRNIRHIIRDTVTCNLKIIPSALALAGTDFELTTELVGASMSGSAEHKLAIFHRIRNVVDELKKDFDIIIMDGTPSLGILPLNIIFASDVLVVPVPTESNDFASTMTFCDLYREHCSMFLGYFGNNIKLPEVLFMPTRYSASEQNSTSGSAFVLDQIRNTFGKDCMFSVIRRHDAVVSNLTLLRRTAFQVNAKDAGISREALAKAIQNFSETFDEILKRTLLAKPQLVEAAKAKGGVPA